MVCKMPTINISLASNHRGVTPGTLTNRVAGPIGDLHNQPIGCKSDRILNVTHVNNPLSINSRANSITSPPRAQAPKHRHRSGPPSSASNT